MEQKASWEVNSSAGQKIYNLSLNPKTGYRIRKEPATGPYSETDEATCHPHAIYLKDYF
jgi:hypothetical protein